jgi:Zn-dependent peptidase ImmA (M78 family)
MYKRELKNTTSNGCELRDMNRDTYRLRKNVMSIIYEAKNMIKNIDGFRLPRVEVRIVSQPPCRNKKVFGYAYLGKNIIHIREDVAKHDHFSIYHTVYHELVHALFNKDHNKECPLMSVKAKRLNKEECERVFVRYYKEWV